MNFSDQLVVKLKPLYNDVHNLNVITSDRFQISIIYLSAKAKHMKKFILSAIISMSLLGPLMSQTTLDTALNFTVKDVNGINIELFDILDEGKIVVIDFFSTA